MEKLKKATKRIAAVAASALMLSSAAFGATLGDYPNNFVKDGKFNAKVVVGSTAHSMDTTSANSLIEDLKKEFSGDTQKVKITYKKAGSGGDSVNVVKSNSQLNYGETIGSVTEALDDGDIDFLADGSFDNGKSDEDYTQEILLSNGAFNYALRDNVDGVDKIADSIYYDSGDVYLTYTLEFDNNIALSNTASDNDDDFVGKVLTIMGNEFTIASATGDATSGLTKLELIGGANKVSLGEGESTKVTVNGKSYDIAVQSVSDEKVLLTVNGQSKSINEFDTEDISGVSIAVTDLVSSSRDAVKGYAEIVVGGQKVTLESNYKEVQVNEDDVSDIYPGYLVESDLGGTNGFSTITIRYKVDDDYSLEAGDTLIDPLFGGFELSFDGTNNPNYSDVELRVNDDDINVDGELINGDDFNKAFLHTTTTTGADGVVYLKGKQDADRTFFDGSVQLGTAIDTNAANTTVSFNFTSTTIKGSGFFMYDDAESQYLYEVSSVSTTDKKIDVDELVNGKDKADLKIDELGTKLEVDMPTYTNTSTLGIVTLSDLGTPVLAFDNERMMNFANAEDAAGVTDSSVTFSLDSDVDGDSPADELESFDVTLGWDTTNTELDLGINKSDSDFVNKGLADIEDGNSDTQIYVTAYGTMVEFDNDQKTKVTVKTPEEQVYAKVNLVTGGSGTSTMTKTVDASDLASAKADLEGDGYTIISTEDVAAADVTFDVTGVTLDSAVTGTSNMIVVGGPAVNSVARSLLGIDSYTVDKAGVANGEGIIKYYSDVNSVLVYGYTKEDTAAAVAKLNDGNLSGTEQKVN